MPVQRPGPDPQPCGIASAVNVLGERWSFLILRGAFFGLNHFEQFQAQLGIARNILANRLAKLVEQGILERTLCADDRRKVLYTLTAKGEALLPVLAALRQWGDRWQVESGSGMILCDAQNRQPIQQMELRAADNRTLTLTDLVWVPREELVQS